MVVSCGFKVVLLGSGAIDPFVRAAAGESNFGQILKSECADAEQRKEQRKMRCERGINVCR